MGVSGRIAEKDQKRIGGYQVIELIGKGAYGSVY